MFRKARSFSIPPGVFAAVLLLRLTVLSRLSDSPLLLPTHGDMHFYDGWAQRIAAGEGGEPHAFYGLPGYAWLLAALYRICGHAPYVPLFFQALADAGTATLIFLLARRLVPDKVGGTVAGLLAAIGWAFFVPAQAYGAVLMPTSLVVFVYWLVVWSIVRREAALSLPLTCLVGLLIGLAATAVATILFLIPLVLVAVWSKRPTTLPTAGRTRVLTAALFLGAIVLGTSPCWIHNYFVARDPVVLSAHSGVNFWIGNNPTANGYPHFPPGLRAGQVAMLQDSIDVAEQAAGHPLKRAEVSHYWSALAWNYIKAEPLRWLALLAVKMRNLLSSFQYDDLSIITTMRESGILFPGIYFGLVVALALPASIVLGQAKPLSRWITAAVLLQFMALLPVFVTERYRLPVVPGLLVLASVALVTLAQRAARARYNVPCVYGILLVPSLLLVSWPQRNPALWALDAYNSGWQALDAGNLPLAEQKLNLAYAYVPKNAATNLALGNLWLERHDLNRAQQFYNTAVRLEPSSKAGWSNLGVVAFEQGELARAAQLFRTARDLAPNEPKSHYLLARTEWNLGHVDTAREEIESAVRLRPTQGEFLSLRSLISAKP